MLINVLKMHELFEFTVVRKTNWATRTNRTIRVCHACHHLYSDMFRLVQTMTFSDLFRLRHVQTCLYLDMFRLVLMVHFVPDGWMHTRMDGRTENCFLFG